MRPFSITLPLPPSTNHLYTETWGQRYGKSGPRRRIPTRAYKAWKDEATLIIRKAQIQPPRDPSASFGLEINLGLDRRSDIDNRCKAILDILTPKPKWGWKGVTPDDRFCDSLIVRRCGEAGKAQIKGYPLPKKKTRARVMKDGFEPAMLQVLVEPIPPGVGAEFKKWCFRNQKRLGIEFLGGPRRAWSEGMKDFVRESDVLIMDTGGRPYTFGYRAEMGVAT